MPPQVNVSVTDGAIGTLPEDTTANSIKLGTCSAGTAATLYSFRGPDTQVVRTTLGEGPLVESVVNHLRHSGGKTVYAWKIAASVAGANGAVTKSGAGPNVTLSGTPNDEYQGIISIVAGGALGVGTFKYSLDGGDNYSPTITIPGGGTYAIPNSGITATFAAGTYVAAETYSWTSSAPGYSNSDLGTALDAILARPEPFGFIHAIGQGTDGTATATLATTMQSKLATAASAKRWTWGIIECPQVDKSTLISAFSSFTGDRVIVAGGWEELISEVYSRYYKRPSAWVLAPRVAKVPISVDPIRNETDSDIESLQGVLKLVPVGAAASTGYHDETATPGLEAARIASLCSIVGRSGFYVSNASMMSAAGSDFKYVQHRRVMDRACEVANQRLTKYLGKRLQINPTTGYILGAEADKIEIDVGAVLRAALKAPGHVSDVAVVVNRADNLLSDPTLRVKVRVTPVGYARTIEVEIGFFNPALLHAA